MKIVKSDYSFFFCYKIIFFSNTSNGDIMKNYSIWKDFVNIKSYPKLENNMEVDVLIIGGGITGIATLYNLSKEKMNVMLVEQGSIGMSTTSNSTGKLTFLQNDLLDKIRNNFNGDTLKLYLDSQIDAIKMIVNIIKKEKINCDLSMVDSILYTNNINEIKKLKDLEKFLNNYGIKTSLESTDLVKSKYMFKVSNTYIFNPLKFVYELSKKLNNIYENTCIEKIIKKDNYYLCYSNDYVIKAKKIVIASHYPYFNLPFLFPLKATLEKSYLSASKYNGDDISLISYSNPFISIRNYKDYIVYLSNSHSINKDIDDSYHFNELKKKIHDLNLKEEYLWSNTDIMTNDGLPYIGEIDDNMFIATGYNTWGLSNGVLAGKIIHDIILKKDNKYVHLFDPKRDSLWKNIGSINAINKSISGYINGLINSKNRITCPHLGCKLIYNREEDTYDCPCHGSRFDKSGNIIMAPANKKISIKK